MFPIISYAAKRQIYQDNFMQNIEPRKICQNLLTKEGGGDIIIKLSNESDGTEKGTKFSSKKYLTNERQCDIM